MRVLHIMASRGLGGAETYATGMMLSLHEAGIDQCVVMSAAAPRFEELAQAGIRMEHGPLAPLFRFGQRRRVRRLIEREKPDLVHAWMRRAASLVPPDPGAPVLGWFGGYYDPKHFRRCDHLAGVTRDIVRHMRDHGVAGDHAHFVPTFPEMRDDPPVDRAHMGTPPGRRVLLALSRLHPKKGLDTLLRALALVPDAEVWLAGAGPLRAELEALSVTLGLRDRVRFLGWRTDRTALLNAVDVCVLPSRYEPFGTVILEAWAAGVPLVACRSAGPASVVEDGKTGLLAPIDDVPALASALLRALDDTPLRQRLIEEGQAQYRRDYHRDAVTRRMIALYEQVTV